MSNTKIRVVTESKDFESLRGVWDSLLQKSQDDSSIYLTYEWVSTWWKYFGDRRKLNILLIEKEGQVVGIVPLMETEYRIGLIKRRALETIGAINCNFIGLIPPENREEAITTLLAYLEEELAKNKLILKLNLVPKDSKLLDLLRRHSSLFSKSLTFHQKVTTLAPYIALPTTWDEYYRSLSQKRRQRIRRALETLEESHSVGFQPYSEDSQEAWLSKFFDLHRRRWQSANVSSEFSNPKKRELYRDIANQFLKKNWLHLSSLTVDNEVVSAEFSCIYNGKLYALTSARDTRYSKYSVGHLHYLFLIRDAIEKQLREFDFQRGDEPYKFYWTKSAREYMQLIIMRKSFWPGLRFNLLRAFFRLYVIRQYSLREIYYLYLIKRREKREIEKMELKVRN